MDIDATPRRKTVPLWVWFVVGAVLLYLVLWGATVVVGLKRVREFRAGCESNLPGPTVSLKSFDPSAAQPKVPWDDKQKYVFVGNFRCPCPLLIRMDEVVYLHQRGAAGQVSQIWLGYRWKEISSRWYWMY